MYGSGLGVCGWVAKRTSEQEGGNEGKKEGGRAPPRDLACRQGQEVRIFDCFGMAFGMRP